MKNEKVVPLKEEDYYDCHNMHQWDSLKVHNALLGSWIWDSTKCPTFGTKSMDENNYKLVFIGDSKLNVYKNSVLETEAWWSVKGTNNSFTIQTEPSIEKAFGIIFFCENKLVFVNSWVDGCDFFFKKLTN